MDQLRQHFGWSGEIGSDRSIVFSHSGSLNGNPFLLARALSHWMGSKTYHGSLQISWTEQVRGSDGKWRSETRYQTLNASIERRFPEYEHQTFIIYGNEAAPDLLFSRHPSRLSALEDGFLDKMRKNRAIKKLEKKSRDLSEGNSFAVMSNREFDALFNATDRNHEVQFRLLFTPLAQQEMLKLLKDEEHGYGDDFEFTKEHMINIVEPAHLRETDIDADPASFQTYELAEARQFFNAYHNDFFRSFYFGLAPLLAIPLYQQHRPDIDIYQNDQARKPSVWEHESIANYHGESMFQHAQCVTRSILKTQSTTQSDGAQHVKVTASGYASVERVEYVPVRGGDGRSHQVPVHWTEYLEVERVSQMLVKERAVGIGETNPDEPDATEAALRSVFEQRGVDYQQAVLRRSVVSALLGSLTA
nr:hypothetical protein [uncultured Herbaspirillum sp.]